MNRLGIVLVTGGLLLASPCAMAQKAAPPHSTVQRQPPKALWDYKSELELSINQVTRMRAAVRRFETECVPINARLASAEHALRDLIYQGASLDAGRQQLERIGSIQLEGRLAEFRMEKDTLAVLSSKQLAAWRRIQQQTEVKQ